MCDICLKNPCDPRCPNADEPREIDTCDICEYEIYDFDTYVVNFSGKIAHLNCIEDASTTRLLEWLGGEVIHND